MKAYILATVERAVRTTAQAAAALVVADGVIGLTDVDWATVASVSGLAGVASVLTSVAGIRLTKGAGPGAFERTE